MENLLKKQLPNPQQDSSEMMEGEEDPFKDLIMVHMSKNELNQLDYMQGGPMIHPETEFRMYPRLAEIIKKPEIKEFLNNLAEEIVESGHADSHVKELTRDLPHKKDNTPFQHTPGDFSEEGIKLEADGEAAIHGDDEIAHIPLEYANYLDSVRGEKIINPEDGLRQYGKGWKVFKNPLGGLTHMVSRATGIKQTHLNEAIRIGATVVGGMFGGPLGAGLGAAAGNRLTGADMGKSLWRGAKTGAAVYGAQTLAGGMGNAFGASGMGAGASGAGAAGTAGATGAAASGAGSGAAGLGMADLLKYGLPIASIGALMHGRNKEKKDAHRMDAEHRAEIARFRKEHGLDEPLHPLVYNSQTYDPEPTNYHEGRERRHFRYTPNYAKGGKVHGVHLLPGEEYLTKSKLIQGEGKGQDDKIPTNVPEGAYVWDASSVSMLGDGSTKAGSAVLEKLERLAEKKAHKVGGPIKLSPNRVPTMLSDGERVTHPLIVSIIGGGSNSKGAKFLDEARKDLRLLKISKGDKLPPKAKNILDHLPRPAQKILKTA